MRKSFQGLLALVQDVFRDQDPLQAPVQFEGASSVEVRAPERLFSVKLPPLVAHGHSDVEVAQHCLTTQPDVREYFTIPIVLGLPCPGYERNQSREVRTGREGLIAGTGHDGHADIPVIANRHPATDQPHHALGVDGVAGFGPIEGH